MYEIAVIERYGPSHFGWQNLLHNKRIPNLTVEQILFNYQGFEGEVLIYFLLNQKTINWEEIIGRCNKEKNKNTVCLHIISNNQQVPLFVKNKAIKMGYDVGVCQEDSVYSSIFNEILFGNLKELISFHKNLNEHLLFQDKFQALDYVRQHNKLSAEGKSVENWMPMTIYEIWRQY